MDEAALEAELSEPYPELTAALRRVQGDILVLGAAGKMGPSLAAMAVRASVDAGVARRVFGVARFLDRTNRDLLERAGVETIAGDLFNADFLAALPPAANVLYLVGQKFGTTGLEARTWAINAWLPGAIAQRFADSRIVAFSSGNVYPLWPVASNGPDEEAPTGPIGEYAQSVLARERVLHFFSERQQTPMALLRLNYAVEPRYGVLRDIADHVFRGEPVDLAMGFVNVIWQRDADAIALRALEHCTVPPLVLNVTGPKASVREIAEALGRRLGRAVVFRGEERETALLSDASRCDLAFGPPPLGLDLMIDRVASWVAAGGRSLDKPTHFAEREGRF